MSRAELLRKVEPDLLAELWLYPIDKGGRKTAIKLGWGCPCSVQKNVEEAWDGYPLLGDQVMSPGQTKTLGFAFLSGKPAADKLRAAGKFYLWEGRFIGEAVVVPARERP